MKAHKVNFRSSTIKSLSFFVWALGSLVLLKQEAKGESLPQGQIILKASWYSVQSLKDEGTWRASKGVMANGQVFDENALTCATRDFPLGTILEIKNLKNGKFVVVKVTDRIGKRFAGKRIDLSKAAFEKLADPDVGIIEVSITKRGTNGLSR